MDVLSLTLKYVSSPFWAFMRIVRAAAGDAVRARFTRGLLELERAAERAAAREVAVVGPSAALFRPRPPDERTDWYVTR